RIGPIQIDSVNVLARSQELVLFARLGPHPRDLLPRAAAAGELFEYWSHEATHVPSAHHHLHRWKMASPHRWKSIDAVRERRPDVFADVLQRIRANGPMVAGEFNARVGPKGAWWDWDDAKIALEHHFWTGALTARRRANDFARVYELTERWLPAAALAHPTPTEHEARKELLMLAAAHHGVATATDLADYHRQRMPVVRPLVDELVAEERLIPVTVEGWTHPAYLHPLAKRPRKVQARALLSPFDSLIWDRERTERLFDFHYRIEIYVPPPKRRYGYYVLPFLLGQDLVGRVDLKADRQAGVLAVQGAFAEPGIQPGPIAADVAGELADELIEMAGWLGLGGVQVAQRGDLANPLRDAVRVRSGS
ncbi:MAG TPA: crosslink repair DNA glycosylase YcaQ family protein, partial [Ilumatobacteraceae bacterium]|nr:crosslink repair DNA glycosylase YcaQ family protein [Ilumatobacteraceae bacterium]